MATRSLEILKELGVRGGVVSRTKEDGGMVRIKILVKRQELEQVLEQVTKKGNDNKENCVKGNNLRQLSRTKSSKSLEARLKDMKSMKIARANQVKGDFRSYWRPALQSIQEEF